MTHAIRSDAGTVTITDAALTQVVVQAAESVHGARVHRPKRHLDIEVAEGRARVELELSVAYGLVLPDVARAVQDEVAGALARMCGLEVAAVDVAVQELDP